MKAYFGGAASVLIHMDPCIDPDCPICRHHLCDSRQEDLKKRTAWTWETLIVEGGDSERLRTEKEEPENNDPFGNHSM